MSHLSIETLARLIDEPALEIEAAHLDACAECRAELEGLKADAAALAALPQLQPPAAQWYAVERQLAAEGLLRTSVPVAGRRWMMPALQLAAAISIFVLGQVTATRVTRLAPSAAPVAQATAPLTREEAAAVVQTAEQTYLGALTRYAELTGRTDNADLVARVAALESIVLTTRAALGEAPADPVINGYHLTALAQRDAMLKQLASADNKTWF